MREHNRDVFAADGCPYAENMRDSCPTVSQSVKDSVFRGT